MNSILCDGNFPYLAASLTAVARRLRSQGCPVHLLPRSAKSSLCTPALGVIFLQSERNLPSDPARVEKEVRRQVAPMHMLGAEAYLAVLIDASNEHLDTVYSALSGMFTGVAESYRVCHLQRLSETLQDLFSQRRELMPGAALTLEQDLRALVQTSIRLQHFAAFRGADDIESAERTELVANMVPRLRRYRFICEDPKPGDYLHRLTGRFASGDRAGVLDAELDGDEIRRVFNTIVANAKQFIAQ